MFLLRLINDLSTIILQEKGITTVRVFGDPFSCEFNGKKILKNHESEHDDAMLNLSTQDRLGTS